MTQVRTSSQLITLLGTRGELRAAVREGTWSRVLHDAYADGPVDVHVRAEAARLLLPKHALICDYSLLWLLGAQIGPRSLDRLDILVPRGEVVPKRAGISARIGLVEPRDRARHQELACLAAPRAAIDLARRLPLPDAVVVCDTFLRLGEVTDLSLAAELVRAERQRGIVVAREAVALADSRAESPPESKLRVLLTVGGLAVVPQHVVRARDGRFVARVDLAVPHLRLAIEYDGVDAHSSSTAFVGDRYRQNELVAAGWTVLRFTAADLREPEALVARVARAVRELSARAA